MRTTHVCMACLASVLATAPLLLTQCGGSGSSNAKLNGSSSGSGSGGQGSSSGGSGGGIGPSSGGDDAGSTSSGGSSSGVDSDASGSGAVGADGAPPGEGGGGSSGGSGGGTSCLAPEGGAPCDPGTVTCGSMSCSTATTECCSNLDGGGTCDPYNGGSCTSGVTYQCNEAADCTSGVCCELDEYGAHSATCMPSCGVGYFQVCRSDSECGTTSDAGAAKKCILQTCPTTEGATTTITVEACAYPTVTGGGAGGGFPGGAAGGGGGTTTYGALPACTAK
jgi:loricrin